MFKRTEGTRRQVVLPKKLKTSSEPLNDGKKALQIDQEAKTD